MGGGGLLLLERTSVHGAWRPSPECLADRPFSAKWLMQRISLAQHMYSVPRCLCGSGHLSHRRDGLQMTVERQQAEILEVRMLLDSERVVSAQWQDRALAAAAAEPGVRLSCSHRPPSPCTLLAAPTPLVFLLPSVGGRARADLVVCLVRLLPRPVCMPTMPLTPSVSTRGLHEWPCRVGYRRGAEAPQ